MEDTGFENSFCDVLSTGQVPIQDGIPKPPRRGMPAFLVHEMKRQLVQSSAEIASWCSNVLGDSVSSDIVQSLRDGTVLCRVAQKLYPDQPLGEWIKHPQGNDDFNRNLKVFEDHCKALGIDKTLLVVPSIFDDNDLACLVTCVFEYIECYNDHRASTEEKEQTKERKEESSEAPTQRNLVQDAGEQSIQKSFPEPVQSAPSKEEPGAKNIITEPLLSTENKETTEKENCCCCCIM